MFIIILNKMRNGIELFMVIDFNEYKLNDMIYPSADLSNCPLANLSSITAYILLI